MQTCGCFRVEEQRGLASETAYIGGDTCDNHLFLPGGLDGSTEVCVIPGIYLTVPADDSDIGMHVDDLRREGTVRTWGIRREMSMIRKLFYWRDPGRENHLVRCWW